MDEFFHDSGSSPPTRVLVNAIAEQVAEQVAVKIRADISGQHGKRVAPRYLDLEQAAQYLSTTPDAVRGLLRRKAFPVSKIGSRVYIDVQEIDRAMADNRTYLAA